MLRVNNYQLSLKLFAAFIMLTFGISSYAGNYSTGNQNWTLLGNSGFSAAAAQWQSLVTDSQGTPYVAYADHGYGYGTTVIKFDVNSNRWVTVGSPGFSAGMASWQSLAIDSHDTLYVAYEDFKDYGADNTITVMKFDASNNRWVTIGNPTLLADYNSVSLAIDRQGTPYVAYIDGVNGYRLTVMKFDASSNRWVTVGNPAFSAESSLYQSLAIDSHGTPYVAYRDGSKGYRLTVMKFDVNTNSWVNVGNPGFSTITGTGSSSYRSLAIDAQGIPYVAYADGENDDKTTVMKFNANTNTWVNVGNPDFSAGGSNSQSLAIDNQGTLYVAYQDYANDSRTTVMKFDKNSNKWINVGSPGFSAKGTFQSLAIANNDVAYVAYADWENNWGTTVMYYKTYAP